jgi:uncharacterized membrane protein HdeD (DUF308 family)
METKNFWESKTVWLNAILTVVGALTLVADALTNNAQLTVPGVLMLVAGVGNVIIRIWFTDSTITK